MSETENNNESVAAPVEEQVTPVAESKVEGAPTNEELEKQGIAPEVPEAPAEEGLENATSEEDEEVDEGVVA